MQHTEEGRQPRILVAATGSVAAIKIPQLCQLLQQLGEVKLASTKSAAYFFTQEQLPESLGPVAGDEAEWHAWSRVGDPVMHIELRRWADMLVIAPLSANSLAKLAHGLCDNLVTCVVRAWDFQRPLLVAPAMNTFMWESPFTVQHLTSIRQLGVTVIDPVSKKLACGDVGAGAMAAPESIAAACETALCGLGFQRPAADAAGT
ncbi:flavin mononucleotide-binding protein 3 [Scenedesmus sp. NREL 46B-D3]|nr:flavin mononucleotide-binding protein 3 [Scenedesmus sp. NREL 46B-D3]